MKILIPSGSSKVHPFVHELQKSLAFNFEVVIDIDIFWKESSEFSIVLFQWPEELFKNWDEPTEIDLEALKDKLSHWQKKSKLIIVRHNIFPHYKETVNYVKLYELMYSFMHGVIHLGEFSKNEYLSRYTAIKINQEHIIVPHPIFSRFSNSITKSSARQILNISQNRFVVLVFGAIRDAEEKKFVFGAFNKFKHPNKLLLISSFPFRKYRGSKFVEPFLQFIYGLIPNTYLNFDYIPDEETQIYFNAADILLIPRKEPLNSGNIPLGFQFGKVVVGPDFGNVGEILRNTGNPTFDFRSRNSGAEALKRAAIMTGSTKGMENYQFAAKHWNKVALGEKLSSWLKNLLSQSDYTSRRS